MSSTFNGTALDLIMNKLLNEGGDIGTLLESPDEPFQSTCTHTHTHTHTHTTHLGNDNTEVYSFPQLGLFLDKN